MHRQRLRHPIAVLAVALAATALGLARQPTTTSTACGPRFEVKFERAVSRQPFTGRVYLVVTKRTYRQPIELVEWFSSEPLFARDVESWRPEAKLVFTSDNCLSYPAPLAELPARTYRVQAVMGRNHWEQHPVKAAGNAYSDVAVFKYDPNSPPTVRLTINRLRPPFRPTQNANLKYVKLKSELLSTFYRRDVWLEAVVGLPEAYEREPERRFPTIYQIPGFDGSLRYASPLTLGTLLSVEELEAAVVFLAAGCPTGHHVFADSANNGPWGQALITELIPHLERHFRLIPHADARYLTGVSSGGWSSLWLQITYPETFGGVWSLSPDPVDFRAFLGVNIYDPAANMLFEPDGSPHVITRAGYFGQIQAQALEGLERVLGRGGQLGSFEAVFSPRGADGRPVPLWDRVTGRIDPQVAEAWRKYDICHVLASNWSTLGPKLAGKLYLYCGDQDDFYLDQPFLKLRDTLAALGSDAHVEVIAGASHMLPATVYGQVAAQMSAQFARRYGQGPGD